MEYIFFILCLIIISCGITYFIIDIKNIFKKITQESKTCKYINMDEDKTRENPIYSLMTTFSEMKLIRQKALGDLLTNQAIYRQSIEENIDKQKKIIEHLDSYFQLQREDCLDLIKQKNEYEILFQNLIINAKKCNDSFIAFNQKLDGINSSFKYNSNASVLLHDLESSFHLLYTHNSQTLMKEIDDIASSINNILYKCSSFPEYLKPINNIIDHYSFKIDTTLNSFNKENKINTMNHDDLLRVIELISKTILNFETEIEKVLSINEMYLNKNIFVLSKMLEN